MTAALGWYLGTTLIGWLCFPLTYKLFRNLPGKGLAFSRAVGLLLWGFGFWLPVSMGVLKNTLTGQWIVLLALVLLSLGVGYKTGLRQLFQWVRGHWRMALAVELVFLAAFGAFAVFRTTSPEITGTEKPMELAFLNGILRSETFPPQDPWLAGYPISYYYFGYVMVALLTRLTGVPAAVGYNLAQALWFALIAVGAYGLLVDLLARRNKEAATRERAVTPRSLHWALLAPVLILLAGNTYGFLDSLHARGVFWDEDVSGQVSSNFWTWLGLKGLTEPPGEPMTYVPQAEGTASWWQASRVIQDVNYSGEAVEVIDEFPNFSFVLGDLHPHVLALPFALLSVGLAFNFALSAQQDTALFGRWCLPFDLGRVVLDAGLIGSLAFLNTWDWPIYAALYAAVFLVRRVRSVGWHARRGVEFIAFGLGLAAVGVLCYLPFFLNFASQAGGILPSAIYATRGVPFWIMFAPLLVPIMGYLIWQASRKGMGKQLRKAARVTGLVLLLLAAFSALLALAASRLDTLGEPFMWNLGASGEPIGRLLGEALRRRLAQPGAWLTLGAMLALGLAVVMRAASKKADAESAAATVPLDGFVALLIVWGVLLTLTPEFIYLLDGFGTRMNTIFKFYFQAWLLWSLAGAYGIAVLWESGSQKRKPAARMWLGALMVLSVAVVLVTALAPQAELSLAGMTGFGRYVLDWLWAAWGVGMLLGLLWMALRRHWRGIAQLLGVAALTAGLIYPALAIPERANHFRSPETWTLDGSAVYRRTDPDLMAAVDWLGTTESGVLAEAVGPDGGDYSQYGRVAMLTGLPGVLGWRYHEVQWRGGSEAVGSRQEDLAVLYETADWEIAKGIIGKYNIKYIYSGDLERATYQVQAAKFQQHLTAAFEQGTVVIYQVHSD